MQLCPLTYTLTHTRTHSGPAVNTRVSARVASTAGEKATSGEAKEKVNSSSTKKSARKMISEKEKVARRPWKEHQQEDIDGRTESERENPPEMKKRDLSFRP